METSLKPVPHKDVPAVSPCLSEVLAATVDSPVDSSLLHSSIPIITITDCSEPADDSQDLCLLCDSTDHVTLSCGLSGSNKSYTAARKRGLCYLCLSDRFNQSHCCVPHDVCLAPSCRIKPLHSSVLCGSTFKDLTSCVLFSSLKDKTFTVNRLQTLILWFFDPVNRTFEPVRCLADTGASHSFLESKKAKILNLPILETKRMSISSFGNQSWPRVGVVQATTKGSTDPKAEPLKATFLTINNLCSLEPSFDLSTEQWQSVNCLDVKLADPQATQNGRLPVEAIIGQDMYYSLVDGASLLLPGGLRLVHTVFDTYMLAGSSEYRTVSDSNTEETSISSVVDSNREPENLTIKGTTLPHSTGYFAFDNLTVEEEMCNLEQFSRLDILGISPEEDIHPVMDHFEKTVKHVDGRFEIELPKKYPQIQKLQSNFSQAFSRTVGGMKKRARCSDQTEFVAYNKAITEYIAKGILEEVAKLGTVEQVKEQLLDNPHAFDRVGVTSKDIAVCYLSHFAQYKASTGKLRVVYDAKAKPCKGALSLNDCLEKGPDLMNALIRILLRFRKGRVAAKADIEKAFLQVGITPKDRDLLRIVWIIDGQVFIYRFTRLPFGLNCSPFLLAAVMRHTLYNSDMDEETRDQILSSFYVDDSVYSEGSLSKLMDKRNSSTEAFKQAGMPLREWNSNDPTAQASFSKEENNRELPEEETVLGLFWDLKSDTIGVNHRRVLDLMGKLPRTKRALWSFVHSLYDPLGLIAPYTIQAKHFTSEVSKCVKGWDSKIPEELAQRVTAWMEDFANLVNFRLPRYTELDNPVWKKLVGFCDASGKGIAACVYVVSHDGEKTVSHLVKANTHLPKEHLKTKIPRLELIGAVMLATLMTEVRKAYIEVPSEHIHYYTDSADVLYWIYSGASHWDSFVANRISSIRNLTEVKMWRHVSSAKNPADIPSRGCSLGKLKDMPLWRYGPDFIREDMIDHESTLTGYDAIHTMEIPLGCVTEIKPRVNVVSSGSLSLSPHILISKVMNVNEFETYHKLLAVTALVLEFINLLDARRQIRLSSPSLLKQIGIDCADSATLRSEAELLWVRAAQVTHFPGIHLLIRNEDAKVSPATKSLFFQHGVFLDTKSHVLCCTTRMQDSHLPASTVYPMLLPTHSTFTELYIRHAHEKVGHQGVPQTLTYIRKEFWILKGRQAVRTVLHRCNRCLRVEGKSFPLPPFPPLPDFRTQRDHAFAATGLDFMGPFKVLEMDGVSLTKVYVLMLTCAVTRCVHLEVTRSLGVKDCIMALERFYSFRGIPSHFESDNGSAFVRYNRELKSVLKSKRAQRYFDQSKIDWNFYTSNSPHMGGFIEKLNDIFKRVSRKTFKKTSLMDFEEFRTMTHYSMAVLNDRPLTYVYFGDSTVGESLSPNKMVIGRDVLEPPHMRFRSIKDAISKTLGARFKELERDKDIYWKQLYDEYHPALYERHVRSNKSTPHLRVPQLGNVCLLLSKNVPRRKWKLCKVIGFKKPRRDKHIRQCRVITLTDKGKPSVLNRSPQFLIPLEVEPHVVPDDPLVKTYVKPEPATEGTKPFKRLPPFWTQPVKLPPSAYNTFGKGRGGIGGNFRAKGKLPSHVRKKGKKNKVPKRSSVSVPLSDKPLADPACKLPSHARRKVPKRSKVSVSLPVKPLADPTWKPHVKPTEVSKASRTLRPRDPVSGLVSTVK